MKKILVVVLVVAIALMAGNAMAVVLNSKHDLSSAVTGTGSAAYKGGSATTAETCVFCHTPHGGSKANGPLWNRGSVDLTSYVAYGATVYGNTIDTTLLNGGSLSCLSCHDGQTAMGTVVNATGPGNGGGNLNVIAMTAVNNINGVYSFIGTDLSNDHPVGVMYDEAAAGLLAISGNGAAPDGIVRVTATYGVIGNTTNTVQCVSCHNPHLQTGGGEVDFLVASNAGSALCTACHVAR